MKWTLILDVLAWCWKRRPFKPRRPRPRFLIVEDNRHDVEMLARLLDRNGYEFDVATTGEAALAMFEQKKHRMVFVDMRLPLMNGWTVATCILEQLPDTHVVMVLGSQDDFVNIEPGYYVPVIIKSVRQEAFLDAIRKSNL